MPPPQAAVAPRQVGMTRGLAGRNGSTQGSAEYYTVPGTYQANLSPRIMSQGFGANIKYNAPPESLMALKAKNPMMLANQVEKQNLRENKHSPVEKSCYSVIRIRFETLFVQFGKTRAELTKFLGWDKARVSRIVNGQEIPNRPTMIKISSFFMDDNRKPIDSSVIWEIPSIIAANEMEEEK